MRRLRTALATTAAACLLTACGGGGNPTPAPLPKTSTPSPTAPASPTPPVMPAAAREKTKAGAVAFMRHYVAVLNYASVSGDLATLRQLSLNSCVKCAALTDGIEKVYAAGGNIQGIGWTVLSARPYGFAQGRYFLDATIQSAPQVVVASAGASPQRFSGNTKVLRAFVLERRSSKWVVSELDPNA